MSGGDRSEREGSMDEDRDDLPSELRGAVARLVEETYPEPAGHPDAERWSAFLGGALETAEERRLENHLVRCRDCFDLVQAIDAFSLDEEGERETGSDSAVAASALARLALREARGAPTAPYPLGPVLPVPPRRPLVPGALAALLVFAVAGWGLWILMQQGATLARLRAPQANAQVVELISAERGAILPAGGQAAHPGPLFLVLHPTGKAAAYQLIVREAASGRERYSLSGLRPDEDLALTLFLPEGLPPGLYRLELQREGETSGGPPLDEIELRVESKP